MICGTAASPESARKGAYYAGPGNRFWEILHESGLTPGRLAPPQYERLLELGIGLTDVVKDQSGVDRDLRFEARQRAALVARIERYAPRFVCFNGKTAARRALAVRTVSYGRQAARIGSSEVFVAPSTSAAARRWWDPGPWLELARVVRRLEPMRPPSAPRHHPSRSRARSG